MVLVRKISCLNLWAIGTGIANVDHLRLILLPHMTFLSFPTSRFASATPWIRPRFNEGYWLPFELFLQFFRHYHIVGWFFLLTFTGWTATGWTSTRWTRRRPRFWATRGRPSNFFHFNHLLWNQLVKGQWSSLPRWIPRSSTHRTMATGSPIPRFVSSTISSGSLSPSFGMFPASWSLSPWRLRRNWVCWTHGSSPAELLSLSSGYYDDSTLHSVVS